MSDEALIRLENLKALNLGPRELMDRVGKNTYPYWRDLLAGKKSFGEKAARGIEEALGIPRGSLDESAAGAALAAKPGGGVAPQAATTDDGIRIPLLANSAGMGVGVERQDEDIMTGSLTLSPNFIRERIRPTKIEALRFINSYGDSMSPTFESGDVLLVDAGVREVKIDGIYVLSAHDRLFIKRVSQRFDGMFTVSSDNPSEKTVEVLNGHHQVKVLGRVVWVWNGRKV